MTAVLQTVGILLAITCIVISVLLVYALGMYRAERAMPRREAASFDRAAEDAIRLNTGRCHCDICEAARANL